MRFVISACAGLGVSPDGIRSVGCQWAQWLSTDQSFCHWHDECVPGPAFHCHQVLHHQCEHHVGCNGLPAGHNPDHDQIWCLCVLSQGFRGAQVRVYHMNSLLVAVFLAEIGAWPDKAFIIEAENRSDQSLSLTYMRSFFAACLFAGHHTPAYRDHPTGAAPLECLSVERSIAVVLCVHLYVESVGQLWCCHHGHTPVCLHVYCVRNIQDCPASHT